MLTGGKPTEAVEGDELIRQRRQELTDTRWTLKLAERNRQHSDGYKSKALGRTMKQMEEVAGSKERGRAEVCRCNRLSALAALDYRFRRGNARNGCNGD
jgi:hypothetical protein